MTALGLTLLALLVVAIVAAPRRTPRDRLPPFIRNAEHPLPVSRRLADWRWSYDQLPPESRS